LILKFPCLFRVRSQMFFSPAVKIPKSCSILIRGLTRCAGAREGFAEHAERFGGLGTSSLVRKKSRETG
jgi:hypothetical protein